MMNSRMHTDFEHQHEVTPTEQPDVFTTLYPAWRHPHTKLISGSVLLGQSTSSAYRTVPEGFEAYSVQAHFLKLATDHALYYEVQRVNTTKRTAVRVVHVKQEGIVRVIVTVSFIGSLEEDEKAQPYDYIPDPSKETVEAAAQPIEAELDDADNRPLGSNSRAPKGWPDSIPWPAVSDQRLSATQQGDISKRIYTCKVRTLSPISSRRGQIVAAIFFSDFYVLDTPLTVQDIPFGFFQIGDRTRTFLPSRIKGMATMNHSLHLCRSEGWDVHDGLLLECWTAWAKGRRAVIHFTMRDAKGRLVATGEQEGFFMFKEEGKSQQSKI